MKMHTVRQFTLAALTAGALVGTSVTVVTADDAPTTQPAGEKQVLSGPQADSKPGERGSFDRPRRERSRDGRAGRGPIGFLRETLKELNLSDEQKTQVRDILTQSREEAHEKFGPPPHGPRRPGRGAGDGEGKGKEVSQEDREARREKMQSMRKEFEAAREANDTEKLEALRKQRQEMFGDRPKRDGEGPRRGPEGERPSREEMQKQFEARRKHMDATLGKIRDVLTADQQTTFDAKIAEAREAHEARRKERMERRDQRGNGEGQRKGPRRNRGVGKGADAPADDKIDF